MQLFGVRYAANTKHGYPVSVPVASEEWDTAEIFADLAEDLGLRVVEDHQSNEPDLILLDADGRRILVQLKRLSAPTPAQMLRLIAEGERSTRSAALHVLVADRVR